MNVTDVLKTAGTIDSVLKFPNKKKIGKKLKQCGTEHRETLQE